MSSAAADPQGAAVDAGLLSAGSTRAQFAALVATLHSLLGQRQPALLYQALAAGARALTGADCAALILHEGQSCRFVTDSPGLGPEPGGESMALSRGFPWTAVLERELVVADIHERPDASTLAPPESPFRSLVVVPITDPGSTAILGALGAYFIQAQGPQPVHLQLLRSLAAAGAAALTNAAAFALLERRLRERSGELDHARAEQLKLSLTDSLTGLANRRSFYLLGAQALRHAGRRGVTCTLALVDIDGLRRINDAHGHEVGDSLIASLGQVLQQTFRASDIVARIGGDQFCVIALETGDDAQVIRRRIQDRVEAFNRRSTGRCPLSVSVGIICEEPESQASLDILLARADSAMYAEKAGKQSLELPSSAGPP